MPKTKLISLRRLVILTLVALGFHWIWEILHGPAYIGLSSRWTDRVWHCIPMVIGDVGLTVVIFLASLLTARLIRKETTLLTVVFISPLFGAIIAVVIEWHAIATGRWAYNDLMPLVPGLEVGVSPVVQMALVPALAIYVAWQGHREQI